MTVVAFDGPAGSGKTHSLMNELGNALKRRPLSEHERVLALTFMHGSRRRLETRLKGIEAVSNRFDAMTLDSFAWRLTQRWRRLTRFLGYDEPNEHDYEKTCDLAAVLLERDAVANWVSATYPYVIVDEAQDMSPNRSAIVSRLAQTASVFLAFDEFQCLSPELLPMAINDWLHDHCQPQVLKGCQRTNDQGLLSAALAVRDGKAVPENGQSFVIEASNSPNLAAWFIADRIRRRNGGNLAVLTPSLKGGFAETAIARVAEKPIGKKRPIGPYQVSWEGGQNRRHLHIWEELEFPDLCDVQDILANLDHHKNLQVFKTLKNWVSRQRRLYGRKEISRDELSNQFTRSMDLANRYFGQMSPALSAMTIQQAKNREFDHVVILWPNRVVADPDQRRRLLYNAITRAKITCKVVTQSERQLNEPPFVP